MIKSSPFGGAGTPSGVTERVRSNSTMRYSMENTNMPVISAKDLNLWYGDFKAL